MRYIIKGTNLNAVQYRERGDRDFCGTIFLLGLEVYENRGVQNLGVKDEEKDFISITEYRKHCRWSQMPLLAIYHTADKGDWFVWDENRNYSIIKDSIFRTIFPENILERKD